MASGDASRCYPGLLAGFTRSILFVPPGIAVVRDVVACVGERHVEWLMHYAGSVRSEGDASIIENQGVRLTVTPFLPERASGWRVSDVTRMSSYFDEEFHKTFTPSIRYRRFSPFRAAESFELLFGLRIGGDAAGDWAFTGGAGDWQLEVPDRGIVILPDEDGLLVQ